MADLQAAPLDVHSVEFLRDPAPTLRWLREHDPVHKTAYGYWLLTRFVDVAGALRDPRLSSDWGRRHEVLGLAPRSRDGSGDAYADAQDVMHTSFSMHDNPEHDRVRTLVQSAFTRAAVDEQRDRIQELVDQLLASGARAGSMDLVTQLAFPLTITIASEMIGIPVDAREQFRTSFEETERIGDRSATPEQLVAARAALVWQIEFMRGVVDQARRSPGADLVSALVEAGSHGEHLTEEEILSTLVTLYTAAGTTTERFVSSGLLLLLQHRDQLDALHADPSLLGGAVTEILRFHHPNQQTTIPRYATEDVDIGGVTIPRGDMVRVSLGAANRDPARWDDPERFDIGRPELAPLAFGRGIHYCIGAALARLQAEVAIGTVVARHPQISLLTEEPRHDPRRMDRYERIEVALGAR